MELTNATRFPAGYALGMQPDGRQLLVVAVKGTFALPDGSVAASQAPLVGADVLTGEPGFSATLYESDFAPRKPKCDVLLNGSAYAPGGVPTDRVAVALQVGTLTKSFDVTGPRAWVKGVLGHSLTQPVPFVKTPVSYDTAFGGPAYPPNLAGRGHHAGDDYGAKPLPCTEERGTPVDSPRGRYRPMAFGAISRGSPARVKLAGTYDQKWLDNVCPFLPADFKEEYYQAAPADQQISHPRGGEPVALLNLSPNGREAFSLPSIDVPVQFFLRDEEDPQEIAPVIDTLLIEPDLRRFCITWRASRPLRRDVFEVEQIVVGRMSRGWYRARELGKDYAPNLAEAVQQSLYRLKDEPEEAEPEPEETEPEAEETGPESEETGEERP